MNILKKYELEMKNKWSEYLKYSENDSTRPKAERAYKEYLNKLKLYQKQKNWLKLIETQS